MPDYVLPSVMTAETAPPVAIASMGPVALAFFCGDYNNMVAAGMPPACAISDAWYGLYRVGFRRQSDGTYRRSEDWENQMAEYAKYVEPEGIMRSGKTLSQANADRLVKVARGLKLHCSDLVGFLEGCGIPMDEEPVDSPAETPVAASATSATLGEERVPVKLSYQLGRAQRGDGQVVEGWANVVTDDTGNIVIDSHGTHFPLEEIQRAADNFLLYTGMEGNDGHKALPAMKMVGSLVIDRELQQYLSEHRNMTGWYVRYRITDPALQEQVRLGKRIGFSIEGEATKGG